MTSMITTKDYQEIKNKLVVLISFKGEKRTSTYTTDYKTAIEEIIKGTQNGLTHLIFEEGKIPTFETSWELKVYKRYIDNPHKE